MNPNDLEPSDAEGTALARWIKWVNWTPKIAAGVLLLLVVAYGVAFWKNGWSKSPDAWGQLGDYIGGLLNPLVAGFALMALVVSVRLQKAELAATRKELENSRLAMQEQATTAEQQRREQRFFDLLNIYSATLGSISFTETSNEMTVTHIGKHAFRFLVSSYRAPLSAIKHIFEQQSEWGNYLTPESEPQSVAIEWGAVSPTLDHYFRTICVLLKELELQFSDEKERRRYVKLFRTQLSRDELNLIGINLLYAPEGKRMQPYVNNSGLLKHMPASYLRSLAERELDSRSFGDKWANITRHSALERIVVNHAD